MATFLVTYDLRKPGQNYDGLIEAIKGFGTWAKLMKSDWLIVSESTAGEIRDALQAHIDSGDSIAVIRVGSGWGTSNVAKDVTAWMKKHL